MGHVSDIKLIRTDTTLDLSQKAEKGMLTQMSPILFYKPVFTSSASFRFGVGLQKASGHRIRRATCANLHIYSWPLWACVFNLHEYLLHFLICIISSFFDLPVNFLKNY
jgi:hypothetical protein